MTWRRLCIILWVGCTVCVGIQASKHDVGMAVFTAVVASCCYGEAILTKDRS